MSWRIAVVFLLVFSGCSAVLAADADPTSEQLEFFERRVRPLLVEHCYKCHGPKVEEPKGGLRLDSRAALLAGGDSGPAVTAGNPDESLLVRAVRYQEYEMPPDGKLADDQIGALVRWVEMGAPWPAASAPQLAGPSETYDWSALRQSHWAWQPVRRPRVPEVRRGDWPQTAVDHFVLARLEEAKLAPAPPADRRTLLRRAYFDLIGLPPTPGEIEAYLADARPDAYARAVDRLLASPRYGERWGRHWLDVARYSDGLGGFLDNERLPHAWRYRDWVVRTLNDDLPYDEFVRQQIAGDLDDAPNAFYGPGFFALGPTYRSDGGDPDSTAQAKSETLDDRVDTLSRAFLGLTVSCARCHDHKFDPIPTQDYYSLAGVFNNSSNVLRPLVPQEVVDRYNQAQAAIKQLEAEVKKRQEQLQKNGGQAGEDETARLAEMRAELEQLKQQAPPMYPVTHSLADTGAADMQIALRGNLRKPGDVAPRRFLRLLAGDEPPRFRRGSGREELAAAVTHPDNPLTARVLVNRVWLHHFGRALVRTPSNFGKLGQPPTHPQLLDWLAAELVSSGWSIKHLHRTIMLSGTYQMSSRYDERSFGVDGDNRLLWRMNPRRLEVEAWRDALLAVAGTLDDRQAGPPTEQLLASHRRTLYTVISRNGDRFASDEFLRLFDFPSARATSGARTTSTVPQQFLFMMNSPFMVDRARELARRLTAFADGDEARIEHAYLLLFGRPPSSRERELGQRFLAAPVVAGDAAKLSPWEQYAQILLCANEFMYVR